MCPEKRACAMTLGVKWPIKIMMGDKKGCNAHPATDCILFDDNEGENLMGLASIYGLWGMMNE